MASSARRILQLIAALMLSCATAGIIITPAQAATSAPDAAIRAAHFSPTTPGVDVYLGRFSGGKLSTKLWLSKVKYGSVSPYQQLRPGVYTLSMRLAGANPSSKAMLTWTLNAKSNAAYTVAGVGAGSSLRGVVIKDNLTAPPAGKGRVRVIQAASRAPEATVSATTGQVIVKRAHFAAVSSYTTLPARTWRVKATSATSPSVSTTSSVTVKSGENTSILLLDAKQRGITLRTVLDSSSSGVMPQDAVPAGGGGTATQFVDVPSQNDLTRVWVLVGFAALLCAGAARRIAPRRRRQSA